MSFPVWVETREGQFAASLVGVPSVAVVEPTRSQAIASLREEIQERIELGDLLSLEIETAGVSSLAGKYSADPTLREICDDAYQLRDAEHNG
jgi:hypothetical protein